MNTTILKIVCLDRTVEIEFFNRGITLFMTTAKLSVEFHRVLCTVDGQFGKKSMMHTTSNTWLSTGQGP